MKSNFNLSDEHILKFKDMSEHNSNRSKDKSKHDKPKSDMSKVKYISEHDKPKSDMSKVKYISEHDKPKTDMSKVKYDKINPNNISEDKQNMIKINENVQKNEKGIYTVKFNFGKDDSIKTRYYAEDFSNEEIIKLRQEFYSKPKLDKVYTNIYGVLKNKNNLRAITDYFFRDIMYSVRRYDKKWSINEFMSDNNLVRVAVAMIRNKPDFYVHNNLSDNFYTHFSIGGFSGTAKISNYPIKSVKQVLKKYNTNNNYYDYSCGWGSRMMGSLAMGVNYFGTDPNQELTEKLRELYKEFNHFTDTSVDIRTQGSEIFIPEFKGKMGLAFSSPPYFNLEEYSTKIIDTYQEWLDTYWTETVKNIYEYLTPNGYFLLNIKSFEKIDLEKDMSNIVLSNGFEFIKFETLEMSTRQNGYNDENTEKIFVFKKSTAPDIEDWSW